MRVIILAAGQAVQLDGYNKLLIKDPESGASILDKYIEAFNGFQCYSSFGLQGYQCHA